RNVYWCRGLETAFVVGLVNPKIYLPAGLGPEEGAYILRHEEIHVRRMDHWMKAAGFLAVCVHWFNPLVWVMFHLLCKDMEMACDEAVLSEMGDNKELKKAYSTSLLNLAAGRRILSITPLAFGEGEVKNRVKNVLNFRRPKRLAVAVTLILAILLGAGLLIDRADSRVQIGYLDSLDNLGPSRIKGSIEYWYDLCRQEPGVIHTYPLEDDYVGPRDDGYLVYYHHGRDNYSYFTLEARAKGDGLQFEVVEHDAVSEEYMKSELFAIVTFKEGEFPLDDVAEVDEIPAVDVSAVIDAFPDEVVGEAAKYVQQQEEIYRADVDADGEKEVLSVAEIDHYLFTLTVSEPDGKILWQGEAGTPHVGWNTYMLYTDSQKELLVRYSPYSSTGMSAYQLQVFQLNGQEEVTLYEAETLFTVGMDEEFPEDTPIFLKNANTLMDKCTILLSTQNGEAVIGPASPEKLQKDNEALLAEIIGKS
ncbi:MAG: M56 family metallopeptidase, partial [Firmicutes bacterium]|nr:M56 family metallopeptidase [Bacillota bacterium]